MARRFIRNTFITAALVALAACSGGVVDSTPPRVQVTTDKSTYAAGSAVKAALRNSGDGKLTYTDCWPAVQRQTATGWSRVDTGAPVACPGANAHELGSGSSITATVFLPGTLTPGTYRIYFSDFVGQTAAEEGRESSPFQLTAP